MNYKTTPPPKKKSCIIYSRPYKIDASDQQPKLKHQVYINVDHSKQSGFQPKISTSSNFQNNHRVSQVIEPVVNTITDAIKKGFTDYNSHKQYGNTACQVFKGGLQNLLDF